jgi:hypothetical protein
MNWVGSQPIEEFLTDWARCASDRDLVPATGDSSRQAAARLRAFLLEQTAPLAPRPPSPTAVLRLTCCAYSRATQTYRPV